LRQQGALHHSNVDDGGGGDDDDPRGRGGKRARLTRFCRPDARTLSESIDGM